MSEENIDCYWEVPAGWLPMVRSMVTTTKAMWPKVKFSCIKKKWGSLRVHFNLDEDYGSRTYEEVSRYVETFENSSVHLCARCGSTNGVKMHKRGWVEPLCVEHSPQENK